MAGRALDGAALRVAFGDPDALTLPARPAIAAPDVGPVTGAAHTFLGWWDRRFAAPAGPWRPDRLAAPFAIGAATVAGSVTLTAADYRGGRVDWHTFDVATGGTLATGDPASTASGQASRPQAARRVA